MARLATIDEILAASETEVDLPALSVTVGEPRTIKVRKLSRAEFLTCLPPNPPGSDSWAKEDWAAKEEAWLATLDQETLSARRQTIALLNPRVVALCAIDPPLTLEQAQRLGDDALTVAAALLRFSGITAPETPVEAPAA